MSQPLPVIQLPDAEAMVISFLVKYLNDNNISTFGVGSRYGPTDVSGRSLYNGSQSWCMVSRIGGQLDASSPWIDHAAIDVSCIGPSKSAAMAVLQVVRSVLAVAYSFSHPIGVIADVYETVGPMWLADNDYAGAGRYLLQVNVTCHP